MPLGNPRIPVDVSKRHKYLKTGFREQEIVSAFSEAGNITPQKPSNPRPSTSSPGSPHARNAMEGSRYPGSSPESLNHFNVNHFHFLSDFDLVVIAEHCCNCQHHNATLRHDSKKYLDETTKAITAVALAFRELSLKIRLGIIRREIENESRIGACEISLAYKNPFGEIIRENIHSKLNSKTWPTSLQCADKARMFAVTYDVPITASAVNIANSRGIGADVFSSSNNPAISSGLADKFYGEYDAESAILETMFDGAYMKSRVKQYPVKWLFDNRDQEVI